MNGTHAMFEPINTFLALANSSRLKRVSAEMQSLISNPRRLLPHTMHTASPMNECVNVYRVVILPLARRLGPR